MIVAETDFVVFLGPTVSIKEAGQCLHAEYRPPAEQGDIFDVVNSSRAKTIVLIDGIFASAPAVRHKELLWAMHQGVEVYGAASMGALRAAELYRFGMRGFGFVYRWYRSTPLADDDEVAVAMMPKDLGAGALTEALIDIRLTLRRAERLGIISSNLRKALVDAATGLYFLDRTYRKTLQVAKSSVTTAEAAQLPSLDKWLLANRCTQKKDDALGLLSKLKTLRDRRRPREFCPKFQMTEAWAVDLEDASLLDPSMIK